MEGPGDAEEALAQAAAPTMKPPVALLVYSSEEPARAAFFPFAVFSPEWQTLRWGAERGVPVRLMDLPQTHSLALDHRETAAEGPGALDENPDVAESESSEARENSRLSDISATSSTPDADAADDPSAWPVDPIALLAEAAGFRDHELWWETQVERRQNPQDLFAGILEAMRAVRNEVPETRERNLLREAHMRRTIRRVLKEDFQNVAVVCGAWHAPVLDEEAVAGKRPGCSVKEDEARLKGLPKIKTTATWIPWTYSRLSYRSGYGAGVTSPGWYAHLWEHRDRVVPRWLALAARLLREHDLDASSASVVEAVRLADALAALRGLQAPGLAELNDAVLSVLCRGDAAPLRLIHNRLEVGDVLGQVPEDAPLVPLAQDLARLEKSLRLKRSTEIRSLDLDLRKEMDLSRSHLFHRLALLGIDWASWVQSGGRASTFHEIWKLEWRPELEVAVIEANLWGMTVESAASAKAVHTATGASDLPTICGVLNSAVLASLDSAIEPILNRLQAQAAVAADVQHLMGALSPLARVARYGDVRGTRAASIEPIIEGLFERAVVGLPAACSSLDDEAAEQMQASMASVQEALDVLARKDLLDEWEQTLRRLSHSTVHALLRGWSCRLLLEKGALDDDALETAARHALSAANPPGQVAAWLAGLLRGSGLLLLHQDRIWQVFDRWLSGLSGEVFTDTLPLLRRAFADFSAPERRQMADKVKRPFEAGKSERRRESADLSASLNLERARQSLPVLAAILGVELAPSDPASSAESPER